MAGRRRGRGSSRRSGSYRWVLSSIAPSTLTQNQQGITQMLATVDQDVLAQATLMRIVGDWAAYASSSDVDTQVSLAYLVADRDAVTAGELPEFEFDDAAWLYTKQIFIREGLTTDTGNKMNQYEIDVKSRRRFRAAANTLVGLAENTSAAANSVTYLFSVRVLLWIP